MQTSRVAHREGASVHTYRDAVCGPPSYPVLPSPDGGVDRGFNPVVDTAQSEANGDNDIDWAQMEGWDAPPEDAPDVDGFFANDPSDQALVDPDPNALFLDIASALHDRLLQLELLD